MRSFIWSALLAALFSPALAEEPVQHIQPFPQACSKAAYGEICLHVWGGMTTMIPLSGLQPSDCKNLKVQLAQLSTRLAAPIGDPIQLNEPTCNAVTVDLPEVRTKTVFRLSYETKTGPAAVLLMAYPKDIWTPLKTWAEEHRLVVNDKTLKLQAVLDKFGITYYPSPAENGKQVCLFVAESEEQEVPFSCKAIIVFYEGANGLPQIYTHEMSDAVHIDVRMPFLDALGSYPLMQQTFVDLVQSALKGE